MKKIILAFIAVASLSAFVAGSVVYWLCNKSVVTSVQAINTFDAHKDELITYVHETIKKQCSYLYNTPDFIAKLTPYYKHKAECIELIEFFFGDKYRSDRAFAAIGNSSHLAYMRIVLAQTHAFLARNPRMADTDALDQVMRDTVFCEYQPGVYDDAYFEYTALSLMTVAAFRLGISPDGVSKKIKQRNRGRSKWRWHDSHCSTVIQNN